MSTISSVCSARVALLLNSAPMIGSLLRIGIAAPSSCDDVVEQPGNRERLPVAQFDVGFGASRRQRRNPEAGERDAVGEIQRADFRPDLEPDHVTGDGRREVQTDAEFLEDNRDGVVA